MSERKQNKGSSLVIAHRAPRKREPKPHELEPISVDYVPEEELADGDVTHVLEPRELPAAGERMMLAALLRQSLEDARRGDPDALAWLNDDAEVGTLNRYTCRQVLDHLSIDVDAFLEKLDRLLHRGEKRQTAASRESLAA